MAKRRAADSQEHDAPSPAPARKRQRADAGPTAPVAQAASAAPATMAAPAEAAAAAAAATGSKRKRRAKKVQPKPLRIRRLAPPLPHALFPRNANTPNLRGSRPTRKQGTGGFAETPADARAEVVETIFVTRKTSFAAYLKRGCAAFEQRAATRLVVRALGAAIPLALRLAPAIRDHLPGGGAGFDVLVKTGSLAVTDEVEYTDDPTADIDYRERTKSTIEVAIARRVGAG